jgi:hypothetical protein
MMELSSRNESYGIYTYKLANRTEFTGFFLLVVESTFNFYLRPIFLSGTSLVIYSLRSQIYMVVVRTKKTPLSFLN